MRRFLSKLLGKSAADAPPGSSELEMQEMLDLEWALREMGSWPRRRHRPTEFDWSRVDYIPLPPSPRSWVVDDREGFHPVYHDMELVPDDVREVDERRVTRVPVRVDKPGKTHRFTRVHATAPSSEPPFTIIGSSSWALVEARGLTKSEQPDPAFEIIAVNRWGTWLLDRSGDRRRPPTGTCVLRRMAPSGSLIAEKSLKHGAWVIGSVKSGSNVAIMDIHSVLYIYDMALHQLVRAYLADIADEVDPGRHVQYIGGGSEWQSGVKAVDTAPQGARYVFTVRDEAWCKDRSGRTVWGIVTPRMQNWERVVRRTGSFGTSDEVEKALRLFGLSLPVNPADIKHKYRQLAFTHHPNRKPGDSVAAERMKAVNRAFEILTGVDPTTLELGESDKAYFARTEPDQLDVVLDEVTITEGARRDEICAASFAAADGGVYIAAESGKIIHLSREGSPLAVYDVGARPLEIAETGRYTYFLTRTKLYVIEDKDKLAACIDVVGEVQLIVSTRGVGLLGSKRLQWFSADGNMLDELTTRDPIRAIYAADGGAIVQTLQHQVRVHGLDM